MARMYWIMVLLASVYGQTTLNIGCIYPFSDTPESGNLQKVVNLAVQEINSLEIIPGYQLNVDVRDSKGSERTATDEVYSMLQGGEVLGIIGDQFSATSMASQRIASLFNAPQLSPATADALGDKNEFPTFLRIVPPNTVQASILVQLIKAFKLKRVAIIYTDDQYGIGFWSAFIKAAGDLEIVAQQSVDVSSDDISKQIKTATIQDRDAILLFAHSSSAVQIIAEASKQKLFGNGQVWIGSDGVMSLTPQDFTSSNNQNLVNEMNGFFGTYTSASGSGPTYDRYQQLMAENNVSPPLGALSYYDACFVYAVALKQMILRGDIPADRPDLFSRANLTASLLSITSTNAYVGASGTIAFNSDGYVDLPYDILNWQHSSGFVVLGKWNGGAPPPVILPPVIRKHHISKVGLAFAIILPVLAAAALAFGIKKYIDRERILWLAETWDDEEFNEESFWDESLSLEVGGLTVDKKQLNFDLDLESKFPIDVTLKDTLTLTNTYSSSVNFKVYAPRNEGKFTCKIHPGHGTVKKGESAILTVEMTLHCTTDVAHFIKIEVPGFENRYTCVQMAFEGEICDKLDPDELEITETLGKGGFGTVYKGRYRGTVVAIKTMNAQSDWVDPEIVSEFQRELALLRKLKHPNIVSFVACSLVPKKMCLAIEFCENGELRNYMKKHKDTLTIAFKLRILLDVAKGMAFLHSTGVFHRDIKPDNILLMSDNIESAVVAKINDFGTARALALNQISQPINHTKCIGTPVYMAPELFLVQPYNNKVDVYSYGIVMWELLTEQMPFYWVDKPWDVYNYVIAGKQNPIPADFPPNVTALLQSCWAQQANDRPTFPTIVERMEELYRQALSHKLIICPPQISRHSTTNLLRRLQVGSSTVRTGVKKKRFPTVARARTVAGGVVVQIH